MNETLLTFYKRYSASKGVGIKGDIAIGVNPKSVDTWLNPNLFRLDKQTGAPPDAFCKTFSMKILNPFCSRRRSKLGIPYL
jgi:4-alpha-glucanotransferase